MAKNEANSSTRKRGRPPKMQAVPGIDPADIMPLDYMLAVVRDPTARMDRRDRMAIAAAPYCHSRITEAVAPGKKEQAQAEALASAHSTEWGALIH